MKSIAWKIRSRYSFQSDHLLHPFSWKQNKMPSRTPYDPTWKRDVKKSKKIIGCVVQCYPYISSIAHSSGPKRCCKKDLARWRLEKRRISGMRRSELLKANSDPSAFLPSRKPTFSSLLIIPSIRRKIRQTSLWITTLFSNSISHSFHIYSRFPPVFRPLFSFKVAKCVIFFPRVRWNIFGEFVACPDMNEHLRPMIYGR